MSLNDDIAAFVEGIADPATQQRVAAAAARDETVRARLALLRAATLRAAEEAPEDSEPIPPDSAARLRARMLSTAQAVAAEAAGAPEVPPEPRTTPQAGVKAGQLPPCPRLAGQT